MKILIFNWRDIRSPHAGGAEIFTHEIAKKWVRDGHEVTLFASRFKGSARQEVVDGVRTVRDGGKYMVYWKARKWYKETFSKEGYDVVIDEINTVPFFTPKFVKEKIVAFIHQLAREFWFYETKFPINLIGYYWLEYRWLGLYKDLPTVTVSNSTKSDLVKIGFKKVFVVPEGLSMKPLKKLPVKNERPTILFVGRFKKVKKPEDVIKAFAMVKQRIPDALLWMVGDGYLLEKLRKKYKDSSIRFFGYVPKQKKLELMRKAWVLAVPGVREGWGLVVTEANAMGTPAVGYNIHGLRDSIKDGKTGFLVNATPRDLATGLIKILEDVNLRKKLSKNALRDARKYSWNKTAKEFMKVLEMVVNS